MFMKNLLVGTLKFGVVLFVLFLAAVALLPRFSVFGNFQSLVVLSGSMEPAIKAGSVVLVRSLADYQVGDIITFNESRTLVTHRIVTVSEGEKIITRGDANRSSDMREISLGDIQGKVIFSVPYLGYAVNFSRTKLGFALFIILPALLIIFDEIRSLFRLSPSAKVSSLFALILFFGSFFGSGISLAYFSDTEIASGNVIKVGVWEERVGLNEIMANAEDEDTGEFVELYNPNFKAIDIGGWLLKDVNDVNDYITDFTGALDWGLAGTVIPSEGYALIVDPEYAGQYNSYMSGKADSAKVIMVTIAGDSNLGNGLGNNSDTVILDDKSGYIDSFTWSNDSGNKRSWERMDGTWEKSASGGTPGVKNGTP